MKPTIDVIGLMHEAGTYDAEGNEITAPIPLSGWHVNTIPAVPEWEDCQVNPSQKRRVFAGMDAETCCYVFEDEAAYTAKLLSLFPEPDNE